MPEYLRALVYVLIISTPAFYVARKIAVPLISKSEFSIWRNCWIVTTCAVFLSRSFFDFAMVLVALSFYIHRYSKQPILLYLILMFAAPCVPVGFGIPGIFNRIIDLNPPRLLAILVLLPVVAKFWRDPENRRFEGPDALAVLFFSFISLLSLRHGDLNSILRVVPSYFLDLLVPYFAFSRALRSGREINQALLALTVAAMPLACVGLFEVWRSWRVYYVVVREWDVVLLTAYLFRDGFLRAATTSVESIAFGFLCMTGIACLLSLRTQQPWDRWRSLALGMLLVGLLSSVSRGPWLGFALCVVVLLFTNLRRSVKLLAGIFPAAIGLILIHPAAIDRFVNLLPFVGRADTGSETYRSELFKNAMIVIERYPFFGSEGFLGEPEMLRMIQGQGIVDVVNSYLQIALQYGLVGLLFFGLFFAILVVGTIQLFFTARSDFVNYHGFLAILLAILFTIATTSSVSVIPHIYWAFAGIAGALLRLGPSIPYEYVERARTRMRVLGIETWSPDWTPVNLNNRMQVLGRR